MNAPPNNLSHATHEPSHPQQSSTAPTIGSLFAGIGGFDLGFERAGFQTAWQVEIQPHCREVLAQHFPRAQRFDDVRSCGSHNLRPVDVICAGFPCQDLSVAGQSKKGGIRGLDGARSGLFWQVLRIAQELQTPWLVLENVVGLLSARAGQDFQTVIQSLAASGYVGCWRVLDSQYFGVPQGRRRVFLVAGLGQAPPAGLLFDARAVDNIPRTLEAQQDERALDEWPAYCLCAKSAGPQITLGAETLVCHRGGRGARPKRARVSEAARLPLGLDAGDHLEAQAAGNAVVPHVAEWVARHLIAHMRGAGVGFVDARTLTSVRLGVL